MEIDNREGGDCGKHCPQAALLTGGSHDSQQTVVRWEGEARTAGGLDFHEKPKLQIMCRLLFSNVDIVSKNSQICGWIQVTGET